MAKHTVERMNDVDLDIDATTYVLSDGYFWFRNSQGTEVYTIKSSDVYAIKREISK